MKKTFQTSVLREPGKWLVCSDHFSNSNSIQNVYQALTVCTANRAALMVEDQFMGSPPF